MLAQEPPTDLVAPFKALADPLRLKVVNLLKDQEMCVCDLCDALDVAQSKLSFHLKSLREAGLLVARQEGRWIYYRLNLTRFAELEQYLGQIRRFGPVLAARPCPPA